MVLGKEFKKRYNGEDVTELYGTLVARVSISNGYETLKDVVVKRGEKLEKPAMDASFLKPYMDEDSVFEFKEGEQEFDFEKPIMKNTTIELKWATKGLKYEKIPDTDYYTIKRYPEFDGEVKHPILSIPSKIYREVSGSKVIKEVKSVTVQDYSSWIHSVDKIVVNEGIKYISGMNGFTIKSNIKEIVLPKNSLKIIENSFSFLPEGVKLEIPRSVDKIMNCFWNSSPYMNHVPMQRSKNIYKIPNTVKTLSLVDTNLEFEDGSKFSIEGEMLFKTEGDEKTLISVGGKQREDIEVPEGVTHIQVGALVSAENFKPFNRLKLPSSWKGIKYNGLKSEYTGANGEYTNPNKLLQGDDVDWNNLKTHYEVYANSIVTLMSNVELINVNTKKYPDELDEYVICDYKRIENSGNYSYEVKKYTEYLNKIVFSAKIDSGQPVEVNAFGSSLYFSNRKPKKKITINSGEAISEVQLRSELGLKENETVAKITANGEEYTFDTPIDRNTILLVDIGVAYAGFNYEEVGGNITVKNFDSSTAILNPSDGTYDVVIPREISSKKVTKINANAFNGVNQIGRVFVDGDIEEIGDEAFKDCENLKKVVIKSNNLKKIGKNAFEDSGLEEIVLPLRNLEEVGEFAFRNRALKQFHAVEEEAETASLVNPYGWFFPSFNVFYNPPIVGRFYFMYYGAPGDAPQGKGGQLVRYMGKTQVEVKKNPTSEETNLVDVHDIDFYAQATAAVYSSSGAIQLGITRRYSDPAYGTNTPVLRYTIKTGAFNYIQRTRTLIDEEGEEEEVETRIQFAVIKKVENRAFNDMDEKLLEVAEDVETHKKYATKIELFKPNDDPDREVDVWFTSADFKKDEIFEDGWWNNIKKTDADYTKITEVIENLRSETAINIM